ncbi:MAG: hypothetical protein NC400_13285 [Clostridium sp.]|nr:hypothetical protein [Clostridium sp.]
MEKGFLGRELRSHDDLAELVQYLGFLPLFQNEVEGFSVEEHTPLELWFAEGGGRPVGVERAGAQKNRLRLREIFQGKDGLYQRQLVS